MNAHAGRTAVANSQARRSSRADASDFARYVAATQAKARADSGRFGLYALRCFVWAIIASVVAWSHPLAWIVASILGGAALWYRDRSAAEARVSRLTPDDDGNC